MLETVGTGTEPHGFGTQTLFFRIDLDEAILVHWIQREAEAVIWQRPGVRDGIVYRGHI